MFESVRLRLTLWYAGVLALSLIAFAFVIYYAAGKIFHERQDESLRSTAQTVVSAYVEEFAEAHSLTAAGQIVLAEITFPNRYVQLIDNAGQPLAASANLAGGTASANLAGGTISIPASTLAESRTRGFSYATVNGLRIAVVPLSADRAFGYAAVAEPLSVIEDGDRKSTRLNSSHVEISYAVFCLKKKKPTKTSPTTCQHRKRPVASP